MPAQPLPSGIKPSDLPSPPAAVLQIIKTCSDADVTSRKIADLVSANPVLSAELLRIVNSAYFGMPRKVGTVAHAVTVLGQKALRNLILCICVRDVLRAHPIRGFDTASYTDDALRRAASARCVGESRGLDADECFTIGLLQDLGLLAMVHVQPEKADCWGELRELDPEARRRAERQRFGTTHDEVAAALAHTWQLPSELAGAMAFHHTEPSKQGLTDAERFLCRVAHCADWMAAVFSANDKGASLRACEQTLAEDYGIDPHGCRRLLDLVDRSVEQAAAALGMRLHNRVSFERIMEEANLRLVEENLSYQELTWQLETTLKERDSLATELNRQLTLLRQVLTKYLPESVAEAIVAGKGTLEPAQKTATILCTDIADFTRKAEGMAPEQVVEMLNAYFPTVTEPISQHGGIVNHFQGDALLATFNLPADDPRHADSAVKAAIAIQKVLRGRRFAGTTLATRIGINTGEVLAGNVGSGERLHYTVYGDAVNIAARLEQLSKQYGASVLVSGTTVALLKDSYPLEPIGEVTIRGKSTPVRIFRLDI
jgi:class 3 adenylate cyclase/HD-like signal output (HDOD) protein